MGYNKIFHRQRPAIGLPHRYVMTEESIKRCIICGVVVVMSMFTGTNCLYAQTASGTINGHEYVDLGLSVKWATCNVGASSPKEYGDYYAWGETSTKSSYDEDNCETWGKSISDIKGTSRDVARVKWGGSWRLPTLDEFKELLDEDNCIWKWTTCNGVNGCCVLSKKNGNSIFLPAVGFISHGASYGLVSQTGNYWSSTIDEDGLENAYSMYYFEGNPGYWLWNFDATGSLFVL